MFAAIAAWISTTFATVVTAAAVQSAVYYAYIAASVIYGVGSSRRAARRQQAAYENSVRDRTVQIRAADSPHQIIYGRARTGGTVTYGLGPTDGQPHFFLVLTLAGHECDALEAVYANGIHMPIDEFGRANQPGNYYSESQQAVSQSITPDAGQMIYLGAGAQLNDAVETGLDVNGDGVYRSVAFEQVGDGVFRFTNRQYAGPLSITWFGTVRKSFVQVRFYRGTPDQQADHGLMAASRGAWTANHRQRGRCYVVVEIDPEPSVFENGLPEFTFLVRGWRVPTTGSTIEWSNNPAFCTRHYLRTYARWPAAAINAAAAATAGTDCAEEVDRDGAATHARYTCDGILSTEAVHRDNVATLLGSMAGTLAFEAGEAVLRAGAYREPTITLTDKDVIGPGTVSSFMPAESTANAIGGRFFDGFEATDTSPDRFKKTWKFVSFPIYKSPVYAAQDAGQYLPREIDLPMTLDTYRAQRIARQDLHRARQALRIRDVFKIDKGMDMLPGRNVYLKLEQFGWHTLNGGAGKVFRIDQQAIDFEAQRVSAALQEEAEAVFSGSYSELDGRDPAPNTDWPTFRDIAPITGLDILTGPHFIATASDGSRSPYARVVWNQVTDPSVLARGKIEMLYGVNDAIELRQAELDPYSTAFHIPTVSAGDFVQVLVRARNSIAWSPWATKSTAVDQSAGRPTATAIGGYGMNAVTNATLRSAIAPWVYYDFDTTATASTDGGSPGGGSADRVLYLGGGGSRPDDRPVPYGAVVWECGSGTAGSTAARGWIYNLDAFPVAAGDVWELQAWVWTRMVKPWGLLLLYYDASGTNVGDSKQAGQYRSSSYGRLDLMTGQTTLAQFSRVFHYCQIPANAVQARFAFAIETGPVPSVPDTSTGRLRLAMPFAARSRFKSIAQVNAEFGSEDSENYKRLSNWNGV